MMMDDLLMDIWKGSYTEPVVLSAQEDRVRERLEGHVRRLAGEIGVRNTDHPEALEEAARYIEGSLSDLGLQATSAEFITTDGFHVRNIEVHIPADESAGTLVVGAHYDTIDCAGANDNGSGIAALLEIASVVARADARPRRALRLAAFANEEPPYFGTADMGSRVYAQGLARSREKVLGMICLETLGYYSTERGSQMVPGILKLAYPNDVGNFVAFCANPKSKEFLRMVLSAFRARCGFPSEGLAAPLALIPDLTLSDNLSFWDAGFPAVMVTDTVYLRYRHYHQRTDTPDRLTYPAFAKVVCGLAEAVRALVFDEAVPK